MKNIEDIEPRLLRAFVAMLGKEPVKFNSSGYLWANEYDLIIKRISNEGVLSIYVKRLDDYILGIMVNEIAFEEEVDSDEREEKGI